MRPVPEEWQQQGLRLARQRSHSDVPTMPEDEGQMPFQGIDGNDEEVGQQREAQGERDVGNCGRDVAVRGRKAQEDEESGGQRGEHRED